MADYEDLSFTIPGYTPETIPLARLIEYLQQMSVVLGNPDSLHLIAINKGSVAPVLHAPKAIAIEAREKAASIQRGDGTKKQVDAYNRIRRMVRRDAGDTAEAAVLRSRRQIVLEIHPAPDGDGVLSGVRQATTIEGQLIRVGGAGEDATLQVQDLQGRTLSGFTTTRYIAKELAKLLWEPVRLSGPGLWERTSEGEWRLERMQVQSFEQLDDDDLTLTVEKLRSLDVAWPDNALDLFEQDREGLA